MTVEKFKRKKEFLICVDSDGCAMDTMDIKHKKCFGPCLVEEWGLEAHREKILDRWNEINLYSATRGINRFKGLAVILSEINDKITKIDGLDDLLKWSSNSVEFSNASLEKEIEKTGSECLKKALNWSLALNRAIEKMHAFADVAIVSSANKSAVTEEWTKYALIGSVDIMLTQEDGSKAHCIGEMKKKGYGEGKALMVGDAVGDHRAAEENGIFFYPILVKQEAESWRKLNSEGLALFREGRMDEKYRKNLINRFYENFSK